MGETANIAQIAAKVADQLFARFLWKTSEGPKDENWPCEQPELHGKRKKKQSAKATPADEHNPYSETSDEDNDTSTPSVTHPTDVVFYYDEPYSNHRTYINCDLKSYAASSIKKSEVKKAVGSLAKAVSCLEKSATWRTRYVADDKTALYAGMLFVYNHDGDYNSRFDELLADINLTTLDIPRNSKLVVLGPRDIFWLDNVSDQIARMRGDGLIGPPDQTRFFFPPLVLSKNVQPSARAATIEMLTGPWIVLKHRLNDAPKESVVVFYRGRGEVVEEFSLLIDYLMFHGLVDQGVNIVVCALEPHQEANALFVKAIDDYILRYEGGEEISNLLKAITFESITQVRRAFSTSEIGMKRGT
ncbi:MAG TPA: hypothetical protein VN577_20465 [Terriglobales bacterium]|nr:hypothetical protein [Terriglobales bacterium]